MEHENEYHNSMVAMLELVWGEGLMAPGGERMTDSGQIRLTVLMPVFNLHSVASTSPPHT